MEYAILKMSGIDKRYTMGKHKGAPAERRIGPTNCRERKTRHTKSVGAFAIVRAVNGKKERRGREIRREGLANDRDASPSITAD